MFAMRRWNPWRELEGLRNQMDRMLYGEPTRKWAGTRAWPALNVWTNDNEAIVTCELPGLDPEKLDIDVTNDVLTIAGSFENQSNESQETYQRRERIARAFERKLQLPFAVDADKAEAAYRHGVLEIRLHRPEEERPRKVTVKAG